MIVDAQQERVKRQLRQRIGRLRRRIDNRLRSSGRQARRLTSWRTYVTQYPGSAIMAALGAGLALSAGLSGRRLSRWLGLRLMRQAWDTAAGRLRQEIDRLWRESTPEKNPAEPVGADHGRS
jgi:hypothetical protein